VNNFVTDPESRSALMSLIRSKNTAPEMLVFAEMRKRKISFRSHYSSVPGSPDLARPRKKLAVFIDGDFWHGRDLERIRLKHGPESVWARKLEKNIHRDALADEALGERGWAVLRVWESDIKRMSTRVVAFNTIASFLCSRDALSTR